MGVNAPSWLKRMKTLVFKVLKKQQKTPYTCVELLSEDIYSVPNLRMTKGLCENIFISNPHLYCGECVPQCRLCWGPLFHVAASLLPQCHISTLACGCRLMSSPAETCVNKALVSRNFILPLSFMSTKSV